MDDIYRQKIKQLRDYAQWERDTGPGGKLHILDWAANEIERLNQTAPDSGGTEVATFFDGIAYFATWLAEKLEREPFDPITDESLQQWTRQAIDEISNKTTSNGVSSDD